MRSHASLLSLIGYFSGNKAFIHFLTYACIRDGITSSFIEHEFEH